MVKVLQKKSSSKSLAFEYLVVLTTKAVLLQIKCIFAQYYYRDTISITDSFASFLGLVLLGDLEEAAAAAQLSNYVNKSSSNEETFL